MRIGLILFTLFQFSFIYSQTKTETEVLEYINDVRTNPQQFLEDVAKPYINENNLSNNRYASSLIKELKNTTALSPLVFDSSLQSLAESYAKQAGKRGWTSHVNVNQRFDQFAKHIDITAENLQFGFNDPLDIVMDLLIDIDIPSYGHRKNILDKDFTLLGVAIAPHKEFDYITVMAFGGFENKE